MSLELDTRQRAMLQEMGIVTYSIDAVIDNNAIEKIAPQAINTLATASKDHKCERCWHYHPTVSTIAAHPTLCSRCDDNLHGDGEVRAHA